MSTAVTLKEAVRAFRAHLKVAYPATPDAEARFRAAIEQVGLARAGELLLAGDAASFGPSPAEAGAARRIAAEAGVCAYATLLQVPVPLLREPQAPPAVNSVPAAPAPAAPAPSPPHVPGGAVLMPAPDGWIPVMTAWAPPAAPAGPREEEIIADLAALVEDVQEVERLANAVCEIQQEMMEAEGKLLELAACEREEDAARHALERELALLFADPAAAADAFYAVMDADGPDRAVQMLEETPEQLGPLLAHPVSR